MIQNKDEKSKEANSCCRRLLSFYFLVVHKLLHHCRMAQPTLFVVLTLEIMQLMQFSNERSKVPFQQMTPSGIIDSVLSCTTLRPLYRGSLTIFLTLNICNLIILLLVCAALGRLMFIIHHRQSLNSLDSFIMTGLNFALFLFRTVFVIPQLQWFLVATVPSLQRNYNLQSESDTKQIVCLSLASFNFFLFITIATLVMAGLRDPDVFSKVPFRGGHNKNQILLTFLKVGSCLFRLFDIKDESFNVYLIVATVLHFIWLLRRMQCRSYYNLHTEKVSQGVSSILFWYNLSKILQYLVEKNRLPVIGFLIVSASVLNISIDAIKRYQTKRLLYQPIILLKTEDEVQLHITTLIGYLERLEDPECRNNAEGYLGNHLLGCKYQLDVCKCKLLDDMKNRGSPENELTNWYHFTLCLVKQSLVKFENSQKLHLLIANILKQRLNNKFSSLYNLARCDRLGSDFIYRLQVEHNKLNIQYEMYEDDERHNEKKSVNINKFFEFNNLVVKFEERIERCVNDHIEFWKELIEPTIDVKKLEQYGSIIISQKEKTKELFDEMNLLNPNNCHVLTIYGYFLMNVANDESQYLKILDRADSIRRNLSTSKHVADEKKMKYGDNSQTAILVISGNEQELGCVKNVNNQVKTLLGWSRKELLGQNVAKVMPKVFGQWHDAVLSRYLSTSEERFAAKQRAVVAISRQGYMLPCNAMTKALPNLQHGIQIVGFLSQMRQQEEDTDRVYNYILYRGDTEVIQGISKTCYENFGIPSVLAYGHPKNSVHQLTMRHILSQSPQCPDIKALLRTSGFSFKIDTLNLTSEFPVNYESQEFDIEDEEEEDRRQSTGQSCAVAAKLKMQLVYNNTPLNLLCFWIDQTKIWKSSQKQIPITPKRKSLGSVSQNFLTTSLEPADQGVKQVKEFKNFISAKSQPLSVRVVFYCALCLVAILFVLAFLSYMLTVERKQVFNSALRSVGLSQRSAMAISEQAYFLRKIHVRNTWLNGSKDQFEKLKNINVYLQKNEYEFLPIVIKSQQKERKTVETTRFSYNNSKLQEDPSTLPMELQSFIGNIYSFLTLDVQNLIYSPSNPTYEDTTLFSVFHTSLYSAVFSLVKSSVSYAQTIYQTYRCQLKQCSVSFPIIMGISLGLIFIALLIIVPYVISVNNINNRVMSLFGIIPLNEVETLMTKCRQYLERHLVEAELVDLELKYMKMHGEDNEITMQNQISQLSPKILSPTSPQLTDKGLTRLNPSLLVPKHKGKGKSSQQGKDEAMDRSKQFMNSTGNSRLKILLQYLFICSLLSAYFVSDYLLVTNLLNELQLGLQNIYFSTQRIQQMRHLKTCSIEMLINGRLQSKNQNISSLTLKLIQSVYDTQRRLNSMNTGIFSPAYSSIVSNNNKGDVCQRAYRVTDELPMAEQATVSECLGFNEAIFSKGIQTVIISRLEKIRSDLAASKVMTDSLRISALNSTYREAETIQKFIELPTLFALQQLRNSLNDRIDNFKVVSISRMSSFMVVLMVLYILFWLPYLKDLNMKIWRTKGMLNMIPMSIITSNEELKREFTSGKLEQAVR